MTYDKLIDVAFQHYGWSPLLLVAILFGLLPGGSMIVIKYYHSIISLLAAGQHQKLYSLFKGMGTDNRDFELYRDAVRQVDFYRAFGSWATNQEIDLTARLLREGKIKYREIRYLSLPKEPLGLLLRTFELPLIHFGVFSCTFLFGISLVLLFYAISIREGQLHILLLCSYFALMGLLYLNGIYSMIINYRVRKMIAQVVS